MLVANVESNLRQIAADIEAEANQIPLAASRALNTAIGGVKTDGGRVLRKRYPKLKLRDISDLIELRFSTRANLQAAMIVSGRPLSLMRFAVNAKTTNKGKGNGGGVYVDVKGQRKFIPGAWVQTLQNNRGDDYQVIFIRDGKSPRGVKVLKTIAIPNAMNIEEVQGVLRTSANDRFDKEFARLLEVYKR